MKRVAYLIVAIIAAYISTQDQGTTTHAAHFADNSTIRAMYDQQQSDIQLKGKGIVKKILPDDKKGSQHQKFILNMRDGLTLLVAHNIDLAPRVSNLNEGDTVEFYGEYEWDKRGGILHWTHHDPAGRHADGWIKHNGNIYK
jgi:hypothetical protein